MFYSFLYMVYGSGSVKSGVNVNQDEKQLWDLSEKVERVEGNGQKPECLCCTAPL